MKEKWVVYLTLDAPREYFSPYVTPLPSSKGDVPIIECLKVLQGPGGFLQLEIDDPEKDGAFTLLVRPEHVIGAMRGTRPGGMGFAPRA